MWRKLIIALTAFAAGVLGIALALSLQGNPRCCGSSKNACIANLKQIDGAKATWALENHETNDVEVTASVLYGPTNYIRDAPECPQGGEYVIGKISQKPRCSVPAHTL